MNTFLSVFLGFLVSTQIAHAWHDGFWQYEGSVCGAGYAPAWMCWISGAGGASDFLGRITGFVTGIAAGVGVCVFIYACIQMVISQGQDDKMAAAKKMAMIALVGVFLALSVGAIVGYLQGLFWTITPYT